MTDLHTLLASVEKAEGPDRETDLELLMLATGKEYRWSAVHDVMLGGKEIACEVVPEERYELLMRMDRIEVGKVPNYTASIDASLALVERMLPGWSWGLVKKRDEFEGYVHNNELHFVGLGLNTPNPRYQWFTVRHKLPALALLAALLRALIAKGTEND